jgi:uncharacterized protein (TIGR02466 family)
MNTFHHAVFPSIISEIESPCFDLIQQSMIDWIYQYQKTNEGVVISNRGGWQSPSNFFMQETFAEYRQYILQNALSGVSFYNCNFNLSNMWININRHGDYNVAHCHPLSVLSGVLWVKTPKNCGTLKFDSPNLFSEHELISNVSNDVRRDANYTSFITFEPSAGKIILFPAHLYHYVEPNESDEDRISIAFNLNT